jgi:putative methionine-R-sulfoxide reductase with GAF domain
MGGNALGQRHHHENRKHVRKTAKLAKLIAYAMLLKVNERWAGFYFLKELPIPTENIEPL